MSRVNGVKKKELNDGSSPFCQAMYNQVKDEIWKTGIRNINDGVINATGMSGAGPYTINKNFSGGLKTGWVYTDPLDTTKTTEIAMPTCCNNHISNLWDQNPAGTKISINSRDTTVDDNGADLQSCPVTPCRCLKSDGTDGNYGEGNCAAGTSASGTGCYSPEITSGVCYCPSGERGSYGISFPNA